MFNSRTGGVFMSSRLPKSVVALVAAGATAGVIAAQFVGDHEGLSLQAYQDGAQVWTICRGHTRTARPGMTASQAECDALFRSDLGETFRVLDRLVTVKLPAPSRAALASFMYNVGPGNFQRSTLRHKLNAGDLVGACNEIPRWRYVAGQDCARARSGCRGIVERRAQERELCLMGVGE